MDAPREDEAAAARPAVWDDPGTQAHWEQLTEERRLAFAWEMEDPALLLAPPVLQMLAQLIGTPDWPRWKVHLRRPPLYLSSRDVELAASPYRGTPARSGSGTPLQPGHGSHLDWMDLLNRDRSKQGYTASLNNLGLFLAHHADWQLPDGRSKFWWDSVGQQAMLEDPATVSAPIDDDTLVRIAQWFGRVARVPLQSVRNLDAAIRTQCRLQPRDLIQTWLHSLPPWDDTMRLEQWLVSVTGVQTDAYTQAVSLLLPVSMVARALDPGCLYRYVVILEGPEEYRKSSLVAALASPEWYLDFSVTAEGKEAHQILEGVWVAEFSELHTLSKSDEQRLKAFISMTRDTWIPKYSNHRVRMPRRAIFVGTTNEQTYLRGETGNTRFLPLRIAHTIAVEEFVAQREQIFAEALHFYTRHRTTWWQMSATALAMAREQREDRRMPSVYEDKLATWLATEYEVTWQQCAEFGLGISEAERWKDPRLQAQIVQALRALGWVATGKRRDVDAPEGLPDTPISRQRIWTKAAPVPPPVPQTPSPRRPPQVMDLHMDEDLPDEQTLHAAFELAAQMDTEEPDDYTVDPDDPTLPPLPF